LKIQINSKKSGLGRKKSVENVVTLEEGLPFNSSTIFLSYLAVQKTTFTC
jgi:hypothetical protein